MERLQEYDAAFEKIKKATKIEDIDELVKTFVHAEETNFQLFNYVNDLTNEIEKMENQTNHVKEETKKYKGQAPGPVDNQRKKLVEALESRLTKIETKGNAYQDRYGTASKTVKSLKDGIAGLFVKVGCAGTAAAEMLGTAGVTESNMMQYLGLIEHRTNELVTQYNKLKEPEKEPEPVVQVHTQQDEEEEEQEEPADEPVEVKAPSTEELDTDKSAKPAASTVGEEGGEEYEEEEDQKATAAKTAADRPETAASSQAE
jgi:hypothetical protein